MSPARPSRAFDRAGLLQELVAVLTTEVEAAEHAQKETMKGATHEEAKPENDKDTRALEQSYLARGQALRVQELREALLRLKSFEGGVLVTVHDDADDVERTFWLMPTGGGTKLAGGTVLVVTPESPWGRALSGAAVGESREVTIAGKLRDFEVLVIH